MYRAAVGLMAVLGLAGIVVGAPREGAEPPLGVLRTTPDEVAEPWTEVSVTFDRPVAGGLEQTPDAATIFRIEPEVPGQVEWRDPVTLRFTPAAPLRPGTRYSVTVANTFTAMDGSRLPAPLRFSFRVERARILTGYPVAPHSPNRFLPRRPVFRVLLSSQADAEELAARSHVALAAACPGPSMVPLRALRQRRIGAEDPEWLGHHGAAAGADTARDLRRVLELTPVRDLPPGCAAELVLPPGMDEADAEPLRWAFGTYGPLRVAAAGCAEPSDCHYGPAAIVFSTPVRGGDVLRHVRLGREDGYRVRDTAAVSDRWVLEGRLQPRRRYTITVDAGLPDVFGQRLGEAASFSFTTPAVPPSVVHPHGKLLVERQGFRTLAVQHVNVDTLEVAIAAVPDSLEGRLLSRGWGGWQEVWAALESAAERRRIGVRNEPDRSSVTGVALPVGDARRTRTGTLLAVQVTGRGVDTTSRHPLALVQVTDLAVHARVGVDQAVVWVTGVADGRPRRGVEVRVHDAGGAVRGTGRTDRRGVVLLQNLAPEVSTRRENCEEVEAEYCWRTPEGYVSAQQGADRALVGISEYDPDLSPYQFGVFGAWGEGRAPVAAAVFTERGIYRPGEPVYAKAIVRRGPLGALAAPAAGDSVRWRFTDREDRTLREVKAPLSRYGTADQTLRVPAEAPLGIYGVEIAMHRGGRWRIVGSTFYQVAEYRPPEFLVEVTTPAEPRHAGDAVRASIGARYLFGAPMGRAPVRWTARLDPSGAWELEIPGTGDYQIGDAGDWWEDGGEESRTLLTRVDTLDPRGYRDVELRLPAASSGRPSRLVLTAEVVDANRQTVSATGTTLVHPAEFYLGARPEGSSYFWTAGAPVRVGVIAVRPDGDRVAGVEVTGAVVRREWHRVRRDRGGVLDEVGEWVSDTVATCRVTTAEQPQPCSFTPRAGGAYTVTLTARDRRGRTALTRFTRWAVGGDWVPWNDESKFKMDVIADRERYAVGDTATLLLASPFTDAEAWITVERERVLEQRRIRITSGTTTLRIPITEALAPNAFVSVVVARGRSAPPGTVDDPGRPTLRVGYAELRVTPEVKRLAVELTPLQPEYRPGDTARVRVRVRDGAGRGQAGEVTLWAVDEGVLSLTGYETPDPLDLIYMPRGLGLRLGSNLVAVAPQVPEGQKGTRNPGGGGGQDLTGILRSRFRPTAFFLGSVETDRSGEAVVSAALPDNITTYRLMAVAVTAGDRFGSGQAPLLATRPLIARPALPRFLREGDQVTAGVVINHRFGAALEARVAVEAQGVTLAGAAARSLALSPGRGGEARFDFHAPVGDSATFRFDVSGGGEGDAVRVRIPIRPANRPVVHTVSGVLRDTATAEFVLPAETDAERSGLALGFGTSPLAMIQAYQRRLLLYPYLCTEQISSQALPVIALLRAQQGGPALVAADSREQVEGVVRLLARRQRPDGGIGLWSGSDWTSPWLTAYAAGVLLEARAAGVTVPDTLLGGAARYLEQSLRAPEAPTRERPLREILSERVMAVDFLSRLGRSNVPAENLLLGQAARLAWEDRVALAEVLGRRGAGEPARRLLAAAWQGVQVRGTRAVLPDSAYRRDFYFASRVRPAARLLTATLTVQPDHPGVAPLVETLVQQGREEARVPWTTQDYGAAVLALARFEGTRRGAEERPVRLRAGNRVLLETRARRGEHRDTLPALTGLLGTLPDGRRVLRLGLEATGSGSPVFYHLSATEVVTRPTFTPRDRGIAVERWYESLETRRPVTSAAEGEVVRVRLRLTIPDERRMVVLDDPLPAGLEAVDLSLRTVSPFAGEFPLDPEEGGDPEAEEEGPTWAFGSWDSGMWSPFDHKEIRDDRVIYFARQLWRGTYHASYLARATSAGRFTAAPAHAEEMYNPGVHGRSGGGVFHVRAGVP